MLSILYWNINKQDLSANIARLVRFNNSDIIILDESGVNPAKLLFDLNSSCVEYEYVPKLGCDRFEIFVRFSKSFISPRFEANRISIRQVKLPGRLDFLLSIVHLPSKVNASASSQLMESTRYAGYITQAENSIQHHRTVLVGDLNMNPFDDGVVGSAGFHATMCRKIATKRGRKVQGEYYHYFYNPMWSLMGDYPQGPPGTHFHLHGEAVELFWNMYDQILVRPDLLPYFDNSSVKIATTDGFESLVKPNGLPISETLSDHLPIIFSLNV